MVQIIKYVILGRGRGLWRNVLSWLTVFLFIAVLPFSPESLVKASGDKKSEKFANPKSTYQTYIEAVRRKDLQEAKDCWIMDDDKQSGSLDVIVGIWISERKLSQMVRKEFGAEAARAILKGWEGGSVTDTALDHTKKRLAKAEVKIIGDTAELRIKWQKGDGYPNEAFEFGERPRLFRKVHGNWKIDANQMTGLKRGSDFFKKGTWGPMFRDQVVIMNEAVVEIEKGKLKTVQELKAFIDGKISAMTKKYEQEMLEFIPKGK